METRIGARTLMSGANFQVQKGDKIGLVGCDGAGTTTMTKILASEGQPINGKVCHSGSISYIPQDPRAREPEQLAMTRILNARGLGDIIERHNQAGIHMSSDNPEVHYTAMRRYSRPLEQFESAGEACQQFHALQVCPSGLSRQAER